jgi:hypothetical protein
MIINDPKNPSHDGSTTNQLNQPTIKDPVLQAVAKSNVPEKEKSELAMLLEVIMRREARLAKSEEAEEFRRNARDKQREFNAQHHSDADIDNQRNCKHLKGGKNGPRSQVRDFAISLHTYINAEQVIRCHICSAKWKIRDTKDYLYRQGKQVPNHTRIGWEEACTMLTQSTNRPSSSEIPYNATPVAAPTTARTTETEL